MGEKEKKEHATPILSRLFKEKKEGEQEQEKLFKTKAAPTEVKEAAKAEPEAKASKKDKEEKEDEKGSNKKTGEDEVVHKKKQEEPEAIIKKAGSAASSPCAVVAPAAVAPAPVPTTNKPGLSVAAEAGIAAGAVAGVALIAGGVGGAIANEQGVEHEKKMKELAAKKSASNIITQPVLVPGGNRLYDAD